MSTNVIFHLTGLPLQLRTDKSNQISTQNRPSALFDGLFLLREVISAAVIGRILNFTGCILIFEDNAGVANFALRPEHKGRPSADACNRNSF